jgi:hypothetical protein
MPLKSRLQRYIKTAFIGVVTAVVAFLLMGILVYKCCYHESKIPPSKSLVRAPARVSSGACIPVYGRVLGDVMPWSKVNLYQVSSTEFEIVMQEKRSRKPIESAVVNAKNRFRFRCLFPGDYAFVIPVSSYDGSVGAPLPEKFECGGLHVDIAFQGGDWQYAVGAFTINESRWRGCAKE